MSHVAVRSRHAWATAAGALLLASCAAGPDYRAPTPPALARVTATPLPETTSGGERANERAQRFVPAAGVTPQWWRSLGSPAIDRLVDEALQHNPSIDSAQAALTQAMELAAAQRGAFFPSLQFSYQPPAARCLSTVHRR